LDPAEQDLTPQQAIKLRAALGWDRGCEVGRAEVRREQGTGPQSGRGRLPCVPRSSPDAPQATAVERNAKRACTALAAGGATDASLTPEQPETAGVTPSATPTSPMPPTEPAPGGEAAHPSVSADPPEPIGLVVEGVDPVLETVTELPLPEVDAEAITDLVGQELLPPVDVPSATGPVQVPPLPGLPPLP
jgi:hypothetical protein